MGEELNCRLEYINGGLRPNVVKSKYAGKKMRNLD
jgi:hypothetical protein